MADGTVTGQCELTQAAFDLANAVRDLIGSVRVIGGIDADLASSSHQWSVVVPVLVGPGLPVADDAPDQSAIGLAPNQAHEGGRVIRPGDTMRIVGGTNGHMLWPPSTRIMEIETGQLAGERVQFILEPDPRPAGEAAVLAALALVRADEPALNDPVRLELLRRDVMVRLASGS
jgi:hypothetical protein